jgi:malonyl CoA-acyl carrier protein transacylase
MLYQKIPKSMKKTLTLVLLLATTLQFSVIAQEEAPVGSLDAGTISSQFDYINTISNNFQEYKVVKRTHLDKIRQNVLDSLNVFKEELVIVNQELSARQEKISGLEKQVSQANQDLETAEAARDNFEIFGIPIHKSAFTTLMGLIIGVLAAALLFFLFKYSKSHKVISQARKDLAETVEELENHRKNTLERERKLKRELVDALNRKVN